MAATHDKSILHAYLLDSRWTPNSRQPEISWPSRSCPAEADHLKCTSLSIRPNAAAVGWIIELLCRLHDLQTGELFFFFSLRSDSDGVCRFCGLCCQRRLCRPSVHHAEFLCHIARGLSPLTPPPPAESAFKTDRHLKVLWGDLKFP